MAWEGKARSGRAHIAGARRGEGFAALLNTLGYGDFQNVMRPPSGGKTGLDDGL